MAKNDTINTSHQKKRIKGVDVTTNKSETAHMESGFTFVIHVVNNIRRVVGKMKDEMNGVLIVEFIGLKAKMYALSTMNPDVRKREMRKAKGVQSAFVKNKLSLDIYKEVLFAGGEDICNNS